MCPVHNLRSLYAGVFFLFSTTTIVLAFFSCSVPASPPERQGESRSHEEMLRILAETQRKILDSRNIYASEARLAQCDSLLALAKEPADKVNLNFIKAGLLLEYGNETEAVRLYDWVLSTIQGETRLRAMVQSARGMAYLRLAERQNCNLNHGQESCVMPIRGDGIHQHQAPARTAIEAFSNALSIDPGNLDNRWLLNIAYMTLGEYPRRVPAKWLIPGLDASGSTRVKGFVDIGSALRVETNNRAGGTVLEDFDNDGLLDIVNSAWGLDDPMHFFQNNGDGTFTDASEKSGLSKLTGGLNLVSTDYNNDGRIDIFVLRGGWQGQSGFGEQPRSLLRNNGDGTFTDVTIEVGLLSFQPSQTATWNDFNNDGWLDVFIGNETVDPSKPYPCQLYLNNGDGTFRDIAPGLVDIVAFVKGVTSGDYNNDGWPDIFISTFNGQKLLLRNRGLPGGQIGFENVTEASGLAKENYKSFTTWFFDFDNDGWLDLFTCDYDFERPLSYYSAKEALHPSADRTGKIHLYHNNHDGTFTDYAPQMNVGQTVFSMGGNFGDIDNDGWLDMYLGTGNPSYQSLVPNHLYKNLGGRDFADVTATARVGNLQKGHGVSFGDIDNDGNQDIYTDLGGAFRGDAYHSSLFLNPGQSDNNWIYLQLEGKRTNRAAIGARVTVQFTENGVKRKVYREVNSGGSFGSSSILRREIGIGAAAVVDEITIYWPGSQTTQSVQNVPARQLIKIVEGENGFQPLPLKNLAFKNLAEVIPMCVQ